MAAQPMIAVQHCCEDQPESGALAIFTDPANRERVYVAPVTSVDAIAGILYFEDTLPEWVVVGTEIEWEGMT